MQKLVCENGRIGGRGLIECGERDNGAMGATEESVTIAFVTVTGRVASDWRLDRIAHLPQNNAFVQ